MHGIIRIIVGVNLDVILWLFWRLFVVNERLGCPITHHLWGGRRVQRAF